MDNSISQDVVEFIGFLMIFIGIALTIGKYQYEKDQQRKEV